MYLEIFQLIVKQKKKIYTLHQGIRFYKEVIAETTKNNLGKLIF